MATIGEVKSKIKSEIKSEHEIDWKIHNFSSLSDENSVWHSSPTFSFCKESWYLQIYPNGGKIFSKGYISLFLRTKSCGSPIKVEYTLGLKTLSGQKVSEDYSEYTFSKAEQGYGCYKLLLRSEIFEKKADLLPNDAITIFCSLKFPTSAGTPIKEASNEKCPLCEKVVDADNLSLHQRKDKPIKCPDCSAVLTLQNWCDHECQAHTTDCEPITELSSESLCEDYKRVLLEGCDYDIIFKIDDREFRAHKDVLRARSRVFKSAQSKYVGEKQWCH